MTSKQVMQQALEALEGVLDKHEGLSTQFWSCSGGVYEAVACNEAIEALKASLAQQGEQGEQHSIPVSAYNRLQALCDSQAETIMKLQDKLDSKSSCKNSAWGADVMQRIVDSQTGFVRKKP